MLQFKLASQIQHDRIELLLRAAFTPYAERVGYALTPNSFASLRSAIDEGRVHVALDDELVVGTVVTSRASNDLRLDYVAIAPERQNLGLGGWLLSCLEKEAQARNVEALTLHTAEIAYELLRFYDRLGFVETHRALPVHGKDSFMRVHMRKTITKPHAR